MLIVKHRKRKASNFLSFCKERIDGIILMNNVKPTNSVKIVSKQQPMKTYGGVKVHLHTFLTSALDEGERSAARPGRITRKETTAGMRTPWIGGSVGPKGSLDAVKKLLHLPRIKLRFLGCSFRSKIILGPV
jgi:hypothetical protein